ncbi:MAG TPA: sigma-70 family RNA polymerase sigma factor, partial [Vicinamibacterales bacterium]
MTFTTAFETYAPFAWSVLALLGVAPADIPDVSQEVFLVLHRRWKEIDLDRSLKSWLYGVCARKAAEYRRSRHARKEVVTAEPPEGRVEGSAEDVVDRNRAAALLDWALDQLDDDRRAVFVLYEIQDLTIAEVAAAVGCPLQT